MKALEARQMMESVHLPKPQRGTLEGELQYVYQNVKGCINSRSHLWSVEIRLQGEEEMLTKVLTTLREADGFSVKPGAGIHRFIVSWAR